MLCVGESEECGGELFLFLSLYVGEPTPMRDISYEDTPRSVRIFIIYPFQPQFNLENSFEAVIGLS